MDNELSEFETILKGLRDTVNGHEYGEIQFALGYFIAELAEGFSEGDMDLRDEFLDDLDTEIQNAVDFMDESDPQDAEPLSDNDPVSDVIYSILDGLEDEEKLEYLAIAAAEVLQEYEPGEDRDVMIEYLGQNIDAAIEVLDEAEAELEEVDAAFAELTLEAQIGEVVDAIADGYLDHQMQNVLMHPRNPTNEERALYRGSLRSYVNGHFDIDLPLHEDASYDIEVPACTCCQ